MARERMQDLAVFQDQQPLTQTMRTVREAMKSSPFVPEWGYEAQQVILHSLYPVVKAVINFHGGNPHAVKFKRTFEAIQALPRENNPLAVLGEKLSSQFSIPTQLTINESERILRRTFKMILVGATTYEALLAKERRSQGGKRQ